MIKFKWKKLGKIFDPNDYKYFWMDSFAQAPNSLLLDDRLRVFFSTRPKPNKNHEYVSYSGYVDFTIDGKFKVINISSKPILELGDKGNFDEFGIYPFSVLKQKDRTLAYYAGWTRCESVPFNTNIGMAIGNKHGDNFKKFSNGPIISYSPNEPFVISSPKIRYFDNTYYLFYIAGKEWILDKGNPEPVYKIRMATSKNGVDWNKDNRDLISWKLEPNEAQASPDVFYLDGKYHMFFCYRKSKDYRNKSSGYRIGHASSNDLFNWERDENIGIDVSNSGWDEEMISYPHVFFLNNKIYMMYLGNQVGKEGFGIAVNED